MRRLFGLLLLLPLLAGCFAPGPPRIEPYKDVEGAFRVPLPVPTDASGGWALADRRLGVIGQGRVAARIDENGEVLWRTRLPARFALTERPGQAHSVANPSAGPLTLIGAAPPGRFPLLATLDPWTGRFAELAYPPVRSPGELRLVTVTSTSGTRLAVAATCLPASSCTVTAWDAVTGQVRWKHRTRGPAVFAPPCGQDGATGKGTTQYSRRCDPLVFVADGRLVTLQDGDDQLQSRPVALPQGDIAQVIPSLYRILVVTAPHGPGCRAHVAAYGLTAETTTAPAWQRNFTWDQPQAAVREGCRWDPSIPLFVGSHLTLPEAAGALVGDDYDGTYFLRLKPGEYPVAYGIGVLAYRTDGSYRDPQPPSTVRRLPMEFDPAAQNLGQGVWYIPGKGRRGEIIAIDVYGKITWRRATSGQPFFVGSNRLVYPYGSDLAAIRTAG
ncbi:PQQ-binding-like beta-propeller repeat protein [Streptomyces sp. NPDC096323]|uniref:PQQ-binding-like beta-propeller repeat protein n=1 Tax=Streptomyces sp. NPDC096323 TaxID=3155822 RepID=UPI00331D08F9